MKKQILLKSLVIAIIALTVQSSVFSQGVVISETSGATPDADAILDIQSTTQGILIPRMTTTQKNDLTDASTPDGLLIYDITVGAFYLRGNSGWINLSSSAEIWTQNTDGVYLKDGTQNVGIGTEPSSMSKLIVQADSDAGVDDPLFQIKDKSGKTILSVTSSGVRINQDKDMAMAASGGFAVGQYASLKSDGDEFFKVTPFQTTVNTLPPGNDKGIAGGFAVGQYASLKGGILDYNFYTNAQETRIYTGGDKTPLTKDGGKAIAGGFAVGQYGSLKADGDKFMYITPENYFIGHSAGLATLPLSGGVHNIFVGYESGLSNTTGHENTYVGHLSGRNQVLGTDNVFLGNGSGQGLSSYSGTPLRNVILGAGAGNLLDDAIDNVFIGHFAGEGWEGSGVTGDYNVIIGESAGRHITSGANNVFMGTQSGFENLDGNHNMYLGYFSGKENTGGHFNTYLGSTSGAYVNGGTANTFLGYSAGSYHATGDDNVYIGKLAGAGTLTNNGTGHDNVYVGNEAGTNNTSGYYNVFLGYQSGYFNKGGSSNIFLGYLTGRANLGGNSNTFLGTQCGAQNESGSSNTFVGNACGQFSTQSYNTFLGHQAGQYHTTGESNVYIGNSAGSGTSTTADEGINNVYIGKESGMNNTSGNNNVFMGTQAGNKNTLGQFNVFLGYRAGFNNIGNGTFDGAYNVFIGNEAGLQNISGGSNVYIGHHAEQANHTGGYNVTIGRNAAAVNPSGTLNVYIGAQAANWKRGGNGNVFVGNRAGEANESGADNVFIGAGAGTSTTGSPTGTNLISQNVAIGRYAAYTGIGLNNVIIGYNAGRNLTNLTSSRNVFLGNASGYSNTGTDNIFLGHYAGYYETGSEKLYITNDRGANESDGRLNSLVYGEFDNEILKVNGTFTFNKFPQDVRMPLNRGATGDVLVSNGTGEANWSSISQESTSAENGVNLNGNVVELGGDLIKNTTITQGGTETFTITNAGSGNTTINLSSTGNFNVQDNGTSAFFVENTGYVGIGTNNPIVRFEVRNSGTEDILNLFDGSTEVLTVIDGGNVGIGTTAPEAPLDVETNSSGYAIHIEETGTYTEDWRLGVDASGDLNFFEETTSRITFEDGGNVGIGIANPIARLDVRSSGSGDILNLFDGATEVLTVIDGGNVGIGTTAPEAPLDVETNSSGYAIHIEETGTGTEDWRLGVDVDGDLNFFEETTSRITFEDGGNVGIGIANPIARLDVRSSGSGDILNLFDGATEVLTVEDGGDVGIGISNPTANLHIYDIADATLIIQADYDNNTSGTENDNPRIELRQDGTSVVGGMGYVGEAGQIYSNSLINAMYLVNNYTSSLQLGTSNEARITIEGGGDVGIGTTSPDYKLQVAGQIAPEADNLFDLGSSSRRWDDVYATNGVIQTSDKRLKENIQPLTYGINEIMKLKPVSFTWIDNPRKKTKLGLIAQDVQTIISEAVYEDEEKKTDLLGINYSDFVPILIKGMQEQQNQIENQQNQINDLKEQNAKIESLEQQIQELKELIQNK